MYENTAHDCAPQSSDRALGRHPRLRRSPRLRCAAGWRCMLHHDDAQRREYRLSWHCLPQRLQLHRLVGARRLKRRLRNLNGNQPIRRADPRGLSLCKSSIEFFYLSCIRTLTDRAGWQANVWRISSTFDDEVLNGCCAVRIKFDETAIPRDLEMRTKRRWWIRPRTRDMR